ncbi:hypothetical protein ACIQF5_04255 [Streptomyces goshikiensis]|uniref:hypothetical protein n=1 Tax=Streptomyces goshikiensis TaxID=1942 RepID=UPI003803576F
MSTFTDPLLDGTTRMSAYERQLWEALNEHWQRRNNRRGLPNWASTALGRTGQVPQGPAVVPSAGASFSPLWSCSVR